MTRDQPRPLVRSQAKYPCASDSAA
jgi:hypothetical protein